MLYFPPCLSTDVSHVIKATWATASGTVHPKTRNKRFPWPLFTVITNRKATYLFLKANSLSSRDMTKWVVTFFKVLTSTKDQTSDILYANGAMQVPINVFIKAIDPNANAPYSLTQDELDGITLVEYNNTANELDGDWSYSDEENEYAHSLATSKSIPNPGMYIPSFAEIPQSSQIRQLAIQADMGSSTSSSKAPQWKHYWVTTTKIEERKLWRLLGEAMVQQKPPITA